jgi:multidrug resistance efflux pump
MIGVLTLLYVGLLVLAVKLRLIRPTPLWKLSPLVFALVLMVALFVPMQFWAPQGPVLVAQYGVQIVPNVAGQVVEVPVEANAPLKKGDVLFRIDPTPYQAAVDDFQARLELAQLRLAQATRLAQRGAGSAYDVEGFTSQVKQLQAGLDNARFNLEQTTVRAPADGYVTNLALRPGARVAALPLAPVMAFVETGKAVVGLQLFQNHLRHVAPGQPVEIAFKMYPGRIFEAKVLHVQPASATGLGAPTGLAAGPQQVPHAPMWVRLELGEQAEALNLPVGATGTAAVYTDKGAPTHIIRRVVLRQEGIMNFILPF